MKKQLAVFFGGRSSEHEVSIVTGVQLIENVDKQKYDVIPVYIAPDGKWYTGDRLLDVGFYKQFDAAAVREAYLLPIPGQGGLACEGKGLFGKKREIIPIDVIIPAMHGMGGEDGTLQGLFELADIPYAETGVMGAAVGMDKIVMRAAFLGMGLPALEYDYFTRGEWEKSRDAIVARIQGKLGYPIFVKPANLGSSIGINKANTPVELAYAIDVAVQYDKRVIVERGVTDMTEINCSALGVGADVRASVCEQPISWKDFLSFEDKYLRGGKNSKGMQSLSRKIPAPIPDELTTQVRVMTKHVFSALDCKGVVRVDYIYDNAEKRLYINEINTIPGSFAFYLWEYEGLKYPQLIDLLVEQAEKAHAEKSRSVYAYDSDILNKAKRGAKSGKSGK